MSSLHITTPAIVVMDGAVATSIGARDGFAVGSSVIHSLEPAYQRDAIRRHRRRQARKLVGSAALRTKPVSFGVASFIMGLGSAEALYLHPSVWSIPAGASGPGLVFGLYNRLRNRLSRI